LSRPLFGGTCLSGPPSEGRACRVRCLERPACQIRRATLDYLFGVGGRDRHAPPNGHDERATPKFLSLGGTRLSRPGPNVESTIPFRWVRETACSYFSTAPNHLAALPHNWVESINMIELFNKANPCGTNADNNFGYT
jgi:hypothetical protein